ncbi:hypothetical protein [Ralstonia pseudosolanacearum]|uniref:Uncharacterized protein n=1 Tax=Ralstonia pseudosolanacearum TaxID=1310165 RepID=A0A454TM31_9RALS|nr:hypothetical protein [Ralstonia pseudosolanacearum]RNM03206.1 hypothetical protein EGA29_19135 [Ralstonia pseudosolanacearum]
MTTDQINLELFFDHMLEDYKAGALTKEQAIGGLVAFSAAINRGDFEGARQWAEQGRKLARDLISLDQAALLLSRPTNNLPH